VSVECCCKGVPRAQKLNFSISQYLCEKSCQRPGEVITTDFIDGFITNNFRLISVPNKIPDLPNKKASPNGMYPINVEKMDDIRQVVKYIDHDTKIFRLLF
jgi:hypothetical protein